MVETEHSRISVDQLGGTFALIVGVAFLALATSFSEYAVRD